MTKSTHLRKSRFFTELKYHMIMVQKLITVVMNFRRKMNRKGLRSFKNIMHAGSSHSSHTSGALMYGSSEIIYKSFAYLMNNRIFGNYAEFGVFHGSTTLEAVAASRVFGLDHLQFYIFDSFEGLPELDPNDAKEIFFKGQFSSSVDNFLNNLQKEKADLGRINVFPGYYHEILPKLSLSEVKFSFVFIDCDLYSSTVPVLEFIRDKLLQGSIIAFDDWYCYDSPDKGERKAVAEWLQKNPDIELIEYNNFHWAGKSFIVNFR
jgi:O-methyltransferase